MQKLPTVIAVGIKSSLRFSSFSHNDFIRTSIFIQSFILFLNFHLHLLLYLFCVSLIFSFFQHLKIIKNLIKWILFKTSKAKPSYFFGLRGRQLKNWIGGSAKWKYYLILRVAIFLKIIFCIASTREKPAIYNLLQ